MSQSKPFLSEIIIRVLYHPWFRFLVNTSGSGKTRLLFEGLVKHWGFYFTTNVNEGLGSKDMADAITKYIPESNCFTHKPGKLDDDRMEQAYILNHAIAQRRAHQVLTSRILVFECFLKMAQTSSQSTNPMRPIDQYKEHWLLLQLCSKQILGVDLFAKVSDLLKDASDDYLMVTIPTEVKERLVASQEKYKLDTDFYLILDEAQRAIEELVGCFRSESKKLVNRPVLRPIISAWSAAADEKFPIIISGTGLSIDIVNEVVGSAILKPAPFGRVTRTGAFDTRERQLDYISRYMPPHIAESESGKELLERAWTYARGRCLIVYL